MKIDARTLKRAEALYGARGPLVRTFVPKGRTGAYLYAVALHEHPGVVKVGRTANWQARRKSYAAWNLSASDAVAAERVFCLTEDFVDLPALERFILGSLPFPIRFGSEWFTAEIDDAAREIDRLLCESGLSYV